MTTETKAPEKIVEQQAAGQVKVEVKPAESKPVETKAPTAEVKPVETPKVEVKPAETKTPEAPKPAEVKPEEVKPIEVKAPEVAAPAEVKTEAEEIAGADEIRSVLMEMREHFKDLQVKRYGNGETMRYGGTGNFVEGLEDTAEAQRRADPVDMEEQIDDVISLIYNLLDMMEYFFEVFEDGKIDRREVQGMKIRIATTAKTYEMLSERYFPDDEDNARTQMMFEGLKAAIDAMQPTQIPEAPAPATAPAPAPVEAPVPTPAPVATPPDVPAEPSPEPSPAPMNFAGAPAEEEEEEEEEMKSGSGPSEEKHKHGKHDQSCHRHDKVVEESVIDTKGVDAEDKDRLPLSDEAAGSLLKLTRAINRGVRKATTSAFGDDATRKRRLNDARKRAKEEASLSEDDKKLTPLREKANGMAKEIFKSQIGILNKTRMIKKLGIENTNMGKLNEAASNFKAARDAYKNKADDDPELRAGVERNGVSFYLDNAKKDVPEDKSHLYYADMIENYVSDIDTSKGVKIGSKQRFEEFDMCYKCYRHGKKLIESIKVNEKVE